MRLSYVGPLAILALALVCVGTSEGLILEIVVSLLQMYHDRQISKNPIGADSVVLEQDDSSNDFLYGRTAQQIIERVGFQQRTHDMLSKDGYITEMIHLINPLAEPAHLKQPPVILMHGALVDCAAYMWASSIQHHPEKYPRSSQDGPITSSNRSLAFYLANNGYDVWIASWRGSTPSNSRHVKYKPRKLDELTISRKGKPRKNRLWETMNYYDFSQDEMVQYELPLQIETVLKHSRAKKVNVVAWSISTQLMFKLLSSNEAFQSKIHSYVALTPLLNSVGLGTMERSSDLFYLHMPLPVGHIYVNQLLLSRWAREFLMALRQNSMLTFLGYFTSSIQSVTNWEAPTIDHSLRSTSFKVIKHYYQQKYRGRLLKYDYGSEKNMRLYNGSSEPPEYDLSQFKVKHWMMISAQHDKLGTPDSAEQYASKIPIAPYQIITVPHYNHFDVVSGHLNDVFINQPIMEFFDKFAL